MSIETGQQGPGSGPSLTIRTYRASGPPAYGHKEPLSMPAAGLNASAKTVHEGGLISIPNARRATSQVPSPIRATQARFGGDRFGRPAGLGRHAIFQKILTASQVQAVKAYLISRARESAQAAGALRKW